MNDALRYLLKDVQRYMFVVNRSAINPDTGESQDASIALSEKDPIALDESLDPRLKQSRRIIVVMMLHDGGVAKIDFTRRTWEIWVTSPSIWDRLRTFNRKLRSGAHGWLVTEDAGLLIASFPIWSLALLFFVWSFSSRKVRNEAWGTSSNANLPWPTWLIHYESDVFKLWPLLLLFAVGVWFIVLVSGGLRLWPRYLSRLSLQRAYYEMRSNLALPQNVNTPLFVGLAGAVVGAIVTVVLTRYLG
jgi:hypothetical protein